MPVVVGLWDRAGAAATRGEDMQISKEVARRLESEEVIWLTTVDPEGAPSSTPVWFLWNGRNFLIYSQSGRPKLRNIERNPRVSLNLNSDDEGENVVIIAGTAHVDPNAAAVAQTDEYVAKYREGIKRIGMTVEEMSSSFSVPIRAQPEHIRTW
jgi:PPOX class probable F420-dependent enzyme